MADTQTLYFLEGADDIDNNWHTVHGSEDYDKDVVRARRDKLRAEQQQRLDTTNNPEDAIQRKWRVAAVTVRHYEEDKNG